jgi:hypothetical protein
MSNQYLWQIGRVFPTKFAGILGVSFSNLQVDGFSAPIHFQSEETAMQISREELYRRVWESPVTKLAKEFDISDVGLAKVCRKNNIPLPPVGYWMKVQHGKSVKKSLLEQNLKAKLVFG